MLFHQSLNSHEFIRSFICWQSLITYRHASFYPFSGPASLFLHHGILSDEEINQLLLSWRHLSMNSQKHLSYAKLKTDREFYKALNWCFSPSVEIFFVLCPDWSWSWHQLKAWWPFYPHIGFIWCHYYINNFRHLCGRQRKRTLLKTILGSCLLIIK